MRLWQNLTGVFLALVVTAASALDVVVEGSAPIRDGDVGQARELAVRRALSRAAESRGVAISSQFSVRQGEMSESSQMRASACTRNNEVLNERIAGGELTVTLRVTMDTDGGCAASCQRSYINKVVVTGFAFQFPEQILPGEDAWIANQTGRELARAITGQRRLLVEADGSAFPYLSPSRAPEPLVGSKDRETLFSSLARQHRGQYVLSGIYRDFGITTSKWLPAWLADRRQIEIEAFLHDGVNGALLARRTFSGQASGRVQIQNKPTIGSAEFYRGDFGQAWGKVLGEIAQWTTEQATCLPFVTRVLKVEGASIYVDNGSESGLSAGDTLRLQTWREPAVKSLSEEVLGQEKRARGTAVIKAIYPRFAVLEALDAAALPQVRPGDLFYSE
ncbi:MAG: flagellar assembly protein T N-terminal domain-containing protein [Rhodocyclaceae bacterium]